MESVSFRAPTRSLTIDLGGGNDILTLNPLNAFAAPITLLGGDGADGVIVAMSGAVSLTDTTLTIGARVISVTSIETALSGVPTWTEQGPGSISGGQVLNLGSNPVAGAVEAIAVHPFNRNVIFVGTTNGGVWKTTDAGSTWQALTDQFTSLSISSVAVSPFDADGRAVTATYLATGQPTPENKLVVYGGIGRVSSFSSQGGGNAGLLKSENGGRDWRLVESVFFGFDRKIWDILPISSTTMSRTPGRSPSAGTPTASSSRSRTR